MKYKKGDVIQSIHPEDYTIIALGAGRYFVSPHTTSIKELAAIDPTDTTTARDSPAAKDPDYSQLVDDRDQWMRSHHDLIESVKELREKLKEKETDTRGYYMGIRGLRESIKGLDLIIKEQEGEGE